MTSETTSAPVLVERCGAYTMLLRTAFDQICDKNDWKAPINARVPWGAANVYMDAVTYMTAAPVECRMITQDGGQAFAHITSVGYRMGPAGDH